MAIGALLLLGGGTTLAHWSTSATVSAAPAAGGDLNLTLVGEPTWTLQSEGGATGATVVDLDEVALVPGDRLTLTQEVTLTLVGDNLVADLDVVPTTELPDGIVGHSVTVTRDGATFPGEGLTGALNGATVRVTAQFQFDPTTAGRDLAGATFDFADITLTLTQVAAL